MGNVMSIDGSEIDFNHLGHLLKGDDVALIVIDGQYDFMPGGNLAVPEGDLIIEGINSIRDDYRLVVWTRDYHPACHASFASTHSLPVFSTKELSYGTQVLWPEHCVQGTDGSEIHKNFDVREKDILVYKGTNPEVDSYSAFYENDGVSKTGLAETLKKLGIKKIVLVGLARDYCVGYSGLDGIKEGFDVTVVSDLTRGIAPETIVAMDKKLEQVGVKIIESGCHKPKI